MRSVMCKNDYDGKQFVFERRTYDEMHGITLCSIVLNEEKNIVDLINHHKPYVRDIVIIDGGSVDNTMDLAMGSANVLKRIEFPGHFGNQKNRAIEQCITDWVLFIDADERMSEIALQNLTKLIEQEEYDAYAFPRKNFLDGVYDEEHYPDFQTRLFRTYCRYVRPVHEELVGYRAKKDLSDDMAIIHSKGMERHINRNGMYLSYESKYANEKGIPGCQTKLNYIDSYGLTVDGGK